MGDADFDFELIYGMRRRFAAEFTHTKLKIRLTDADDAKAAVLMHIENADRQDITPMERALSFQQQLEAKIFATQDAMAEAFGVSKGAGDEALEGGAAVEGSDDCAIVCGQECRAGGGGVSVWRC